MFLRLNIVLALISTAYCGYLNAPLPLQPGPAAVAPYVAPTAVAAPAPVAAAAPVVAAAPVLAPAPARYATALPVATSSTYRQQQVSSVPAVVQIPTIATAYVAPAIPAAAAATVPAVGPASGYGYGYGYGRSGPYAG